MLSRNWRTRYSVNCLRGHNLRDRTRRDHTHISPATAHTKPANRGLFFVRYFRVKHATARRPRSILNVPTAAAQLPPRPDPMPAVRDPPAEIRGNWTEIRGPRTPCRVYLFLFGSLLLSGHFTLIKFKKSNWSDHPPVS